MQRGDLGLVLLNVVAEGFGKLAIVLRAFLRRAGINQGVAGNDVNGLVGGLRDFLEQVAEVGIGGERGEGSFDTEVTNLGDFFGAWVRRIPLALLGLRQDFVRVNRA